ncbi:NADH dehydrogenase [ubiquinone] 1 beta subcomplex subunit 6 [Tachyglossus aculeatus]|uniref:NADH dehydrogenase [ubiquinone] 1 beta subcomplex subunit 6 n=1 Tax=Tachyglossus aculeatus TaxID=9261 RepID=UPI0018F40E2F|nr:NADH dehydrogenase [ubiquinone] 1 beta subcomplex subunit 6 [Tachyglossus aculeatus]
MAGYTADEKQRLEQLRALRRKWLKDQELSFREPVLPPEKLSPLGRFWKNFLQPQTLPRIYTYKAYKGGVFFLTHILVPLWITHYYLKYHVQTRPYGIVERKPRIFPGDTIMETGEVVPPMREFSSEHH